MPIELTIADITSNLLLLAQEGAAAGSGAGGAAAPAPTGLNPLVFIAGLFFLFYFMVILPAKRDRGGSKATEGLKKNDRVVTIGGIHGTVANVTEGNDIVTLRIDENGNARIKVNRSAIASIVSDKENSDTHKDAGSGTKD